MTEGLTIERADGVLRIAMDRPDVLNALDYYDEQKWTDGLPVTPPLGTEVISATCSRVSTAMRQKPSGWSATKSCGAPVNANGGWILPDFFSPAAHIHTQVGLTGGR